MLTFIMLLIGLAVSVFSIAMATRFGLRGANAWDQRICNKLNSSFTGFNWHFRIPLSIGVIPEFFYFIVLGNRNYFSTQWWALRAGSYLSLLLFIAAVFNRSAVESYYSLSTITENGITVLFTSGSAYWYLNMVNMLFIGLFVLIIIESIRMHRGWAPVRSILYITMSILMAVITLSVLILLIAVSLLYLAYKIIKFFMTSTRRRRAAARDDDDDGASEKLNNNYRRFRAELYAWENDRKASRNERKTDRNEHKENKKPVIRRKRPKIKRKPKSKPKDDDIPRFYPS